MGFLKFFEIQKIAICKLQVFINLRPYRENKPFIGTTRYASISAHKGQELARKDDLESLGYVFVYMLKGIYFGKRRLG